ncbi:ABC transporter permease [Clostridium arbusti]|uniref:ABC transporter permease n=1 Tax=Clostridium arbusti TaxID=1137848 RepID=UPI00028866AF|nr:ABC transporter permease [Clostridium arbusti]
MLLKNLNEGNRVLVKELNRVNVAVAKIFRKIYEVIYKLLAIFIFIGLWEFIARLKIINPVFLPPFSKIFVTFFGLFISGDIYPNLFISLQRSLTGFIVGLIIAIPLGLIIGWFKKFEKFIDPLMQTFRNLSVLALLPVFVLFFGIGETSKIIVIAWAVTWSVLLNTISGVKNVDPQVIKGARSMGVSNFCLFKTVIFPGALTSIYTGIRISATTSILVLIAAEMLGANTGLGYLLYLYQSNIKIPEMFSIIIILALLGLSVNYSLVALEKRLFRWKE